MDNKQTLKEVWTLIIKARMRIDDYQVSDEPRGDHMHVTYSHIKYKLDRIIDFIKLNLDLADNK